MQQSKIQRYILISGVWDRGVFAINFLLTAELIYQHGSLQHKACSFYVARQAEVVIGHVDISTHIVAMELEWAAQSFNTNSCHGASLYTASVATAHEWAVCLQSLDWTSGLHQWTGLVDWTGGLDWWTDIFVLKMLSNETSVPCRLNHDAFQSLWTRKHNYLCEVINSQTVRPCFNFMHDVQHGVR